MQCTIEVRDTIVLRDEPAPPSAPFLRGSAVDLVEGLSVRAPLPANTPLAWHDVARGLAMIFDSTAV
jgi:hypothetical protein